MKKFTNINKFRKSNEQEITLNTTDNTSKNVEMDQNSTSPKIVVKVSNTTSSSNSDVETNDEVSIKSNASKFISKLFESREMSHIYHLQVKGDVGSHAIHLAMSDYYNNVLEMIDELTEIYMGQYDVIEGYDVIDTNATKSKNVLDYFKELSEFIKNNKYNSFNKEDSHLQNIIDEILGLVYKTIYKLRFVK